MGREGEGKQKSIGTCKFGHKVGKHTPCFSFISLRASRSVSSAFLEVSFSEASSTELAALSSLALRLSAA